MTYWIETDKGFWGPWTRKQAEAMVEPGQRIIGEDQHCWPDPRRWLEAVDD